jgi:hypothetical protein
MSVSRTPSWIEKSIQSFKASPKKASTLVVLGAVLIGMWIKLLTGGKGPSIAIASPTSSNRGQEIYSTSFHRNLADGSDLLRWAHEPITPIHRNLFAVPLEYYPRDGTHSGDLSVGAAFWDRMAKSLSDKADQQEQRQILIDNIRNMAAALTLESTMMGNRPGAMVNGEMVQEGSVVAGFRVLKIQARTIVVEREGVKLAIVMK